MSPSLALGPAVAGLEIAVVADNPETLEGLSRYLEGAGLKPHALRSLKASALTPLRLCAVVLFPDELPIKAVRAAITSLRSSRPRTLIVLVTKNPQTFRDQMNPDGSSLLPVVVPKPAFGWAILDAIRAHAAPEEP